MKLPNTKTPAHPQKPSGRKVVATWVVLEGKDRYTPHCLHSYELAELSPDGKKLDFGTEGWWPTKDFTYFPPTSLNRDLEDITDFIPERLIPRVRTDGAYVMFVKVALPKVKRFKQA